MPDDLQFVVDAVREPAPDDPQEAGQPGRGCVLSRPAVVRPEHNSEITLDEAQVKAFPSGVDERDGYREHFGVGGEAQRAVRIFAVPWHRRKVLVNYLLGTAASQSLAGPDELVIPGLTVIALRRTVPAQHPEFPWLYASQVDLLRGEGLWLDRPIFVADQPKGKNPATADMIAYFQGRASGPRDLADGLAVYQVTYLPRPYNVLTDAQASLARNSVLQFDKYDPQESIRWVQRTETYAVQALPIHRYNGQAGGSLLEFTPNNEDGLAQAAAYVGQKVAEPGVLLLPTKTIQYVWHEVPDVPEDAISTIVGKINDAPFDGIMGAVVKKRGTLLCQPPTVTPYLDHRGRWMHTITYRFDYRPSGWNSFPANDGNFYRATFGGGNGGETVYKYASFPKLFQLPPRVSYHEVVFPPPPVN